MPGRTRRPRHVVVIGTGLAGLAAATRLAKNGHRVTVVDPDAQPGGTWSCDERLGAVAPNVISFPAPWRDLFHKTGRPLAAEAGRAGLELVPAPAARHLFGDGSVLELDAGRGAQHTAVSDLCGSRAARAWEDLLDELGPVWQRLRLLGVEAPVADPALHDPAVRADLWADRTLADLAQAMPDPRLSLLILDLAARHGSTPEQTPAFCATTLLVDRTFGRWQFVRIDAVDRQPVSMAAMIELLVTRLRSRGVELLSGCPVTAVEADRRGVRAVRLEQRDPAQADAVVICREPATAWAHWLPRWYLHRGVTRERRAALAADPALAPVHTRTTERARSDVQTELIRHQQPGAPVVSWDHPTEGGEDEVIRISADHGRATPDPRTGVRWSGFASWVDRAPTESELPGVFWAGSWCRSGQGPDREVLSAALAAEAARQYLEALPD